MELSLYSGYSLRRPPVAGERPKSFVVVRAKDAQSLLVQPALSNFEVYFLCPACCRSLDVLYYLCLGCLREFSQCTGDVLTCVGIVPGNIPAFAFEQCVGPDGLSREAIRQGGLWKFLTVRQTYPLSNQR